MFFQNKKVLLVSPEKWGKLRVSKHNYAIALLTVADSVFFLNPPDLNSSVWGKVVQSEEGVFVISYKPIARGKKFLGAIVFSFLQWVQFAVIFRFRFGKFSVVWNFDDGNYDNLNCFGADFKIYHSVDHTDDRMQSPCSKTADIIFSTSHRILEYQRSPGVFSSVINHGINSVFEKNALRVRDAIKNEKIDLSTKIRKVGFWGSLLKQSLDKDRILRLVEANPDVEFVFAGPFDAKQNNLGGHDFNEIESFINKLSSYKYVKLVGPKSSSEIIETFKDVDVLINLEFQYSARWDNGNPHKIMEYLSTGAVVFTSPMIMYQDSELVYTIEQNEDVIEKFNQLKSAFSELSSRQNRIKRIDYALDNTYVNQIRKISLLIETEARK
ncbi:MULTISPECIES: hypothetical protein [unclassified Paraflavitalea]|uniref:hypothetical protein n=1 Tax=unclassified Paraflavitalea TaxID=2798305 RepID=UPI003D334E97